MSIYHDLLILQNSSQPQPTGVNLPVTMNTQETKLTPPKQKVPSLKDLEKTIQHADMPFKTKLEIGIKVRKSSDQVFWEQP